MATCPNKNLDSWKNLVKSRGEDISYYLWDKYNGNVPDSEYNKDLNYQLTQDNSSPFEKMTYEQQQSFEKTIRDLSARISDRIGIPYKIINRKDQLFKGKLEGNTAIINLAYATLDTPIHEILGHPIIRAIKNKTEWVNTGKNVEVEGKPILLGKIDIQKRNNLYKNLLKELEYGKGKEVLDRIKRDYQFKELSYQYKNEQKIYFNDYHAFKEYIKGSKNNKDVAIIENTYTLEEQQEEAIVELLGLMTAEKLDKVKDGKLISLLKRLLKEMKQFVRSLLNLKEVEIDKLPDNMTIGDIADLLAYSNSKLILPGYEVEYTTPDNMKFKTYQEASNHISQLAKSVEDVDLSDVNVNLLQNIIDKKQGFTVTKDGYQKVEYRDGKWFDIRGDNEAEYQISETEVKQLWQNKVGYSYIESFIEKNKEYEQSEEIIEEWKKVNNIQYNPEEIYSRGQGFYSAFAAYSDLDLDTLMANILQHIEDNEKAGGKFALSAFTKPIDETIRHIEKSGLNFIIFPKPEHIMWAANTDVFSGSVWDASEKVNKDKKSELLGVSYTKYPSLNTIDKVQPNLASIVDDLAHHHNELGIQITGNNFRLEINKEVLNETDGQEYYKVKTWVDKINSILDQKYGKLVKPDLSKKILKSEKVYEVRWKNGGVLARVTDYNKAQEYLKETFTDSEGNKIPASEAIDIVEGEPIEQIGIQPTQTKDNLKESIDSIKSKLDSTKGDFLDILTTEEVVGFENKNGYLIVDYGGNLLPENLSKKVFKTYDEAKKELNDFTGNLPKKEYTEQALINTKIAKLKEVAKKYPRSLIRSEVKPIYEGKPLTQWGQDELPFQKIPSLVASKLAEPEKNITFTSFEDLENLPEGKPC